MHGASERDAFLTDMLPRQLRAERALHDGDVSPRLAIWSHHDPVTLFGAGGPSRSGWAEVRPIFDWVAGRFAACHDYRFDITAAGASGGLAYTTGYEITDVTLTDGRRVHNVLRVTHVYRREHGEWRIVHRHGDHAPADPLARRAID